MQITLVQLLFLGGDGSESARGSARPLISNCRGISQNLTTLVSWAVSTAADESPRPRYHTISLSLCFAGTPCLRVDCTGFSECIPTGFDEQILLLDAEGIAKALDLRLS